MNSNAKQLVASNLERLREGDRDEPFFDLLEAGCDVTSVLLEAFDSETDANIREFIVNVVWHRRDSSVIPFLARALQDPAPAVWKQAMDGLVTFASAEAVGALRSARDRSLATNVDQVEFREWIDEAIQQVEHPA